MSRSLTRNRLGGPVRMPQKSQRGASGMPAAGGAGYHPSGTSGRTRHPTGTSVRTRAIYSHPPRRAPSRKDSHGHRCATSHNATGKTRTRPASVQCIVTKPPAILSPDVVPQTMGGAPQTSPIMLRCLRESGRNDDREDTKRLGRSAGVIQYERQQARHRSTKHLLILLASHLDLDAQFIIMSVLAVSLRG